MKTIRFILPGLLTASLAFSACGEKETPEHKALKQSQQSCPSAAAGNGAMGVCAPVKIKQGLAAPQSKRFGAFLSHAIQYPDLSNNDPVSCRGMARIKAHGHPGVILKANQGTGFIDATFIGMAKCARALGMAVGGYDFVSSYNASEAYTFINRLRAAGITRNTRRTFPPTLDVEYGAFNYAGLEHMVHILRRTYGRVNIYTGQWYYTPHAGCRWVRGTTAWLAGYPSAPIPCGVPRSAYNSHQFSSTAYNGALSGDMSLWLRNTSAFQTFTQQSVPHPTKNTRAKLIAQREVIRALIRKHNCKPGPPKPITYRHACKAWIAKGAKINRELRNA